jgi:hypothetical protein
LHPSVAQWAVVVFLSRLVRLAVGWRQCLGPCAMRHSGNIDLYIRWPWGRAHCRGGGYLPVSVPFLASTSGFSPFGRPLNSRPIAFAWSLPTSDIVSAGLPCCVDLLSSCVLNSKPGVMSSRWLSTSFLLCSICFTSSSNSKSPLASVEDVNFEGVVLDGSLFASNDVLPRHLRISSLV